MRLQPVRPHRFTKTLDIDVTTLPDGGYGDMLTLEVGGLPNRGLLHRLQFVICHEDPWMGNRDDVGYVAIHYSGTAGAGTQAAPSVSTTEVETVIGTYPLDGKYKSDVGNLTLAPNRRIWAPCLLLSPSSGGNVQQNNNFTTPPLFYDATPSSVGSDGANSGTLYLMIICSQLPLATNCVFAKFIIDIEPTT